VKKCVELDGFCRSLKSKLNSFFPRDTKGEDKKSCVRLRRIPDWNTMAPQLISVNKDGRRVI